MPTFFFFVAGPFIYSSWGKPRRAKALLKQLLMVRIAAARFSAVASNRCTTGFRNAAITCDAPPRRTRLASSPNVTFRLWCRPFSIPQGPRVNASKRLASACSTRKRVIP
jgi:hypothetical protein